MIFVSPNSFGQSDMVLWDVMIAISDILKDPMMSERFELLWIIGLFEFLI